MLHHSVFGNECDRSSKHEIICIFHAVSSMRLSLHPSNQNIISCTQSLFRPKGNIYVTFPVWTNNGLEDEQKIKKNVEAKYKQCENEVEDQLKKYNEESNLLKKAMHFRNAVQADVDKDNLSAHLREDVPNNDDVMEIGPCLQLVKTGTIWAKMGSFQSNTHTLLGSAVVRSSDGMRV